MNEEQIKQFREIISAYRARIDDFEAMLDDYAGSKSETSKKYLAAAILKVSETFKS